MKCQGMYVTDASIAFRINDEGIHDVAEHMRVIVNHCAAVDTESEENRI